MNLINKGFKCVSSAEIEFSNKAFEVYSSSDVCIYYSRAKGAYALGTSSGEAINEYIGGTQEEASDYINMYFEALADDAEALEDDYE